MKLRLKVLVAFLRTAVIGQLPTLQVLGNLVDGPGQAAYMAALANAAAPMNVPRNFSAVTNASTTALALTAANCANGIVNATIVCSGGSANTNTTDTADAIISTFWPNAYVGAIALLRDVNLNSGTQTLAGGTGVTISGTATIPTLAFADYQVKITNLANPALPGSVATNSTTTTAAVSANSTQASPSSVIPVAATTGARVGGYLGWVNTDGTSSYAQITAINSLNVTVAGVLSKAIASGAAVSVYNNAISITRMYSCVTAIMAA